MTFWFNYESRECVFCKRRISRSNCGRHGAACWPKYIAVMLALLRLVPEEFMEFAEKTP